MDNNQHEDRKVKPWALQWISTRSLGVSGADLTRWQLLMALAAKREKMAS